MQLNRAPTGLSDPKLQVHGSTFHMSQPTVWKMTAYTKHRKVAWIERKLKCGRHYIQRGGRGAAARCSIHLCFQRFQRWLTCFKVFFCAVFTLFFLLIKLYLLEPLERPHRLQESNFPSQRHAAAAASFQPFIVNFIWKPRTMDFCSLLLIFKDSVTSNHLDTCSPNDWVGGQAALQRVHVLHLRLQLVLFCEPGGGVVSLTRACRRLRTWRIIAAVCYNYNNKRSCVSVIQTFERLPVTTGVVRVSHRNQGSALGGSLSRLWFGFHVIC